MSYRPARLHSLAELVPRNLFLGTGLLDSELRGGLGAYGG
jgi:hypothetical protein